MDCVNLTVCLSSLAAPRSSAPPNCRILAPCVVSGDAPPENFILVASPGSLVLLAPPWSVVTLFTPRTYGPSSALRPSTSTAAAGSSLPLASPLSSVTPSPHRIAPALWYSGSSYDAHCLVIAWVSGIQLPYPSAALDPPALSPTGVTQMSAAKPAASWLLPPLAPPWAVNTGELWVCAIWDIPSSSVSMDANSSLQLAII